MRRKLSIDIETYSSVDITKSGLYKYVQSPDFQILLIAYSFDDGPVELLDLAGRPPAGEWIELDRAPAEASTKDLRVALMNPDIVKHAYNAAFEWYCLSKWLGFNEVERNAWLWQWRCTMLHGMYCGYPAGLAAVGAALGLPQDKQKDTAGRNLIKYFCSPCKPSRSNGGRSRNYPQHDPGKWGLFCEYCRQDVVSEMAVEKRFENFPVPDQIWSEWITDLRINDRGVAVDLALMEGALYCGETVTAQLMDDARRITGLDNPNSLQQLTTWLDTETDTEIADLRKDTVKDLLGGDMDSPAARRMLEIRQLLGKTSTKKYNAMEAAVCEDGRIRGLLQFYGANRTGRWAGRLVQVQNLPQTHLEPLDLARELVTAKNLPALTLCFKNVPDTLSQLIRTAFIPAPDKIFIDADFSAIEARVIAWLAGEQWRLDVFQTHGKIYEASASQMFGVPIELITKGNPEYSLRQKGKVAELALGYQGGAGALVSMGALRMGLEEEELPGIVRLWRKSNPKIVELWNMIDDAAIETVLTGTPKVINGKITLARECDVKNNLDFFTITLPSGRKLYYPCPEIATDRWGQPSIGYKGIGQTTKKWGPLETYGGKLTENVVQAIARDCLAEAIMRLERAGFSVVFHVHDEVVLELFSRNREKEMLDMVCHIMSVPMLWAPDLPLGADGWVGYYYRKD